MFSVYKVSFEVNDYLFLCQQKRKYVNRIYTQGLYQKSDGFIYDCIYDNVFVIPLSPTVHILQLIQQ